METAVPAPSPDAVADAVRETGDSEFAEAVKASKTPKPYLEIDTAEETVDGQDGCLNLPDRQICLDLTPLSCKSSDSTHEFANPNQTIIIFDWDDTLCPSTTCMRQHGLSVLGASPEGELAESLAVLTQEAQVLIESAMKLADKVVIVTNAEEGWVDLSCKAWMPSLKGTLSNCECVSARSSWESRGVASPAGWKARAFEEAVDKFYSQYANQSWKNIVSIGDAPHEREALSRVCKTVTSSKKCRSKSVKFVLRPSIQQLTRELQMLRESLKEIVEHNDDLDLHFSAESLVDPPAGTPVVSM